MLNKVDLLMHWFFSKFKNNIQNEDCIPTVITLLVPVLMKEIVLTTEHKNYT
jgi:hypothetical protein